MPTTWRRHASCLFIPHNATRQTTRAALSPPPQHHPLHTARFRFYHTSATSRTRAHAGERGLRAGALPLRGHHLSLNTCNLQTVLAPGRNWAGDLLTWEGAGTNWLPQALHNTFHHYPPGLHTPGILHFATTCLSHCLPTTSRRLDNMQGDIKRGTPSPRRLSDIELAARRSGRAHARTAGRTRGRTNTSMAGVGWLALYIGERPCLPPDGRAWCGRGHDACAYTAPPHMPPYTWTGWPTTGLTPSHAAAVPGVRRCSSLPAAFAVRTIILLCALPVWPTLVLRRRAADCW